MCFFYVHSVIHALKVVSNTPPCTITCAFARITNKYVFFPTNSLLVKTRLHHIIHEGVCYFYDLMVIYAYKVVSTTPLRIKKRVRARNSQTCVFFVTLSLFKTTRTLHILLRCVCFLHVNFLMYAVECF